MFNVCFTKSDIESNMTASQSGSGPNDCKNIVEITKIKITIGK